MSNINYLCPKCNCLLEHDANINKEVCPQCKGIYSFEYKHKYDGSPMLIVRKWAMAMITPTKKELSAVAYMPQTPKEDKL